MQEPKGTEAAANRSSVPMVSDARYYDGQDLEALATLPAYDRLVVPIAKTIEKYLKPPLGKNLLLIARAGEADPSTQPRGTSNGSAR